MKTENRKIYKRIYEETKGYRGKILLLSLVSAISAVITVAMVFPTKNLVDNVSKGDMHGFILSGALFLLLLLLKAFITIVPSAVQEKMKQDVVVSSRNRLLMHILSCDYKKISEFHSGDLINRLTSDIQIVTVGALELLPSLVFLTFKFILAFGLLLLFSGKLVMLFATVCFIAALAVMLARSKIEGLHKGVQEKYSDNQAFLQDTLKGLKAVKMFCAEDRFRESYREHQRDFMNFRLKRWIFHTSARTLLDVAMGLGYLLALMIGCLGVFYGKFTFGGFIAVIQLIAIVQSPLTEIPSTLSKIYKMKASAERIAQLEEIPEEERQREDPKEIYKDFESLEISSLTFSYTDKDIIKSASAKIKKGETVAVKGLSGSGKSTLFMLILGAYAPKAGKILLNFKNSAENIDCRYRKLFAYVPQESYLFSGTIKENITLFNESVPLKECEKALKVSCAYDFINELPEGIDTVIKENGQGFSEGQRQRILIARAILSDSPILLLDEATCSLDEETERRVLKNIKALENKTVLIVTHGDAALSICDRLLVLEEGSLKERNVGDVK